LKQKGQGKKGRISGERRRKKEITRRKGKKGGRKKGGRGSRGKEGRMNVP